VRQRVAEVDQEPIAEVLGDMPVKTGDHLGARLLVGSHHLAPRFRVELTGECRRVHQITEQDGELTAFGLRELRRAGYRRALGCRRGGGRRMEANRVSTPRPDQDSAGFIDGQLFGIDEVFLERFQGLVIELKAQLEDPIG
jgi:hypothetical protein